MMVESHLGRCYLFIFTFPGPESFSLGEKALTSVLFDSSTGDPDVHLGLG